MDLKKAFDFINHKQLLTKLAYYGIRGLPLNGYQTVYQVVPKTLKLMDISQTLNLYQQAALKVLYQQVYYLIYLLMTYFN